MFRYLPIVFLILLVLGLWPGCAALSMPAFTQPTILALSSTPYATPTFPPTWTPRPPTPTNTRVIPIPATATPGPSPTPTRLPKRTKALVLGIQDSHTIEVLIEGHSADQVFTVWLLGVAPPSLSDPWTDVALNWLAQEIGRQVVVLESDEQERNPQGDLLRYVWKGGRMINLTMIKLGLAKASDDAPSLSYGADLLEVQAEARRAAHGLWGPPPTSTPTPLVVSATMAAIQALTATPVITQTIVLTPTGTSSP